MEKGYRLVCTVITLVLFATLGSLAEAPPDIESIDVVYIYEGEANAAADMRAATNEDSVISLPNDDDFPDADQDDDSILEAEGECICGMVNGQCSEDCDCFTVGECRYCIDIGCACVPIIEVSTLGFDLFDAFDSIKQNSAAADAAATTEGLLATGSVNAPADEQPKVVAETPPVDWNVIFGTKDLKRSPKKEIKYLQMYLNAYANRNSDGDTSGPLFANGIFTLGTENAVKAFQSEQGLTADGIVGDATKAKLVELLGDIINGTSLPSGGGGDDSDMGNW